MKEVNKVAFQYRIMIGVQDRGQLSCHKVAVCFAAFVEILSENSLVNVHLF